MKQVFISHAVSDGAAISNTLVREIEALGIRCWIAPRDVVPGQTYAAQILGALEASDGVALVLTPGANASRDVAQEVQIAHARSKTIVPLVVDGTKPAGDLAYFLALRHHVPLLAPGEAAAAVLRSFGVTASAQANALPASSAAAAAAASADGVTGTFEMTVRSTGLDDGGCWLNSEADYRDPLNLGVTLSETARRGLAARLGRDPLEALMGSKISVSGTAVKKRIVFLVNGIPTDRYYFQTHLSVSDANQITVLGD